MAAPLWFYLRFCPLREVLPPHSHQKLLTADHLIVPSLPYNIKHL